MIIAPFIIILEFMAPLEKKLKEETSGDFKKLMVSLSMVNCLILFMEKK